MNLDDVIDSEFDKAPPKHEAANWDADDLGLTWDESEVQLLAR